MIMFENNKRFAGLKAEHFQHKWDQQAITALQAIPGFEYLVKKLMEIGFEQFFRMTNLASNVHVTGKMLPDLQEMLRTACEILDVAIPDLYISTNPIPNAFTYGDTKPFIVLTSGLLESMSQEELFFVLGHELGHIKCGHVLYKTMARHFALVLEIIANATFGFSRLIGTGLEMAIFDWERKSELSADRAGLIVTQSLPIANRNFMKMAASAPSYYSKMDENEFLEQVKTYEDATDASFINQAYIALITSKMTHPFTILRAKKLVDWVTKGEFTEVTGISIEEVQANGAKVVPEAKQD